MRLVIHVTYQLVHVSVVVLLSAMILPDQLLQYVTKRQQHVLNAVLIRNVLYGYLVVRQHWVMKMRVNVYVVQLILYAAPIVLRTKIMVAVLQTRKM